jgi:hypothetical protein
VKRGFALQKHSSDEFVDGVVAAYVFADGQQIARGVEEAGSVESAGVAEDGLGLAELVG